MSEAVYPLYKKHRFPIDLVMLTPEEFEQETRMIAAYVKEGEVLYTDCEENNLHEFQYS